MKPTAYLYKTGDKREEILRFDAVATLAPCTELYAIPRDKDGNHTHKLVPIKPTEEMIMQAAFPAMYNTPDTMNESVEKCYADMIKAAPSIEDIQP